MTKYVIEFIDLSTGAKYRISNEFLNKTTALQVLRQKLARYIRNNAIITEQAKDYFCYKAGGVEYSLKVTEA